MNEQMNKCMQSTPAIWRQGSSVNVAGSGEGPMGPESPLSSSSLCRHPGTAQHCQAPLTALWAQRGRANLLLALAGCSPKQCILGLLSYFPRLLPASPPRRPGDPLYRVRQALHAKCIRKAFKTLHPGCKSST